jgi:hypothetical protein
MRPCDVNNEAIQQRFHDHLFHNVFCIHQYGFDIHFHIPLA